MNNGETLRHSDEIALLYATFPDSALARDIGKKLVEKKLAACVNILPSMISIYAWEDKIVIESECSMLIKASIKTASQAKDYIVHYHPYEIPCVLSLPVERELSAQSYIDWIQKTLNA